MSAIQRQIHIQQFSDSEKVLIASVEKKVEIHNGYAEKFSEATKDIALIRQQNEHQTESIHKLEKAVDSLKNKIEKI